MRKILLATAAGFAAFVADGVAPAKAQTPAAAAAPQPGFSVSVTGRLRFHGAVVGQDGDSIAGGEKLSSFDFNNYGRIRVDMNGRNADGIIYGGRLEIRHDAQINNPTSNANLFFRVANGFIGTPTLGQLRFGSNGVLAVPNMFVGHIMGSIGTGLLDGDGPAFWYAGPPAGGTIRGAFATSFWYSSTGNLNRATGIGYYSPQFFGFDFGVSYAPSENGFLGGCNDANAPLAQCDRISTVTANGDHRYRNIIDAMLRYRGTFGPVGVAASGGLRTADTTNAVAPATARKNPTVGIIGAEVTYAGFTVGGITTFGSASRGFASGAGILPSTGNNDGMFSWQLGARYTFGAFTVGAAYHELRSEGSTAAADPANRKERGFGIGGSYALGPGIALYAEYLNSRVSETGVDFDGTRAGIQDKFNAQLFLLGVGLGF